MSNAPFFSSKCLLLVCNEMNSRLNGDDMIRYGHEQLVFARDGVTAKPIEILNDCPADLHTYAYHMYIFDYNPKAC